MLRKLSLCAALLGGVLALPSIAPAHERAGWRDYDRDYSMRDRDRDRDWDSLPLAQRTPRALARAFCVEELYISAMRSAISARLVGRLSDHKPAAAW
jgi:hypothetical protein